MTYVLTVVLNNKVNIGSRSFLMLASVEAFLELMLFLGMTFVTISAVLRIITFVIDVAIT